MKAWQLIKNSNAKESFRLREFPDIQPAPHEVRVDVDVFGLNFADVMARLGLYRECPPLPTVIGYDVAGKISAVGADVKDLQIGQRAVAFTRFGGYATQVITDQDAVAVIPETLDAGEACALATQYCTAYFAAEEMVRMHEGDHVLIQAAAGGVGTALIQLAKYRKCVIYGGAGSDEKLEYIRQQGVDFPINYRKEDFYAAAKKKMGDAKPDVIFNSIGGRSVRDGIKFLGSGGRIVCYGAAEAADEKNKLLANLKLAWGFGLLFPPFLLMQSKALIGINMLAIADSKPQILKRVLHEVVRWHQKEILKPTVGKVFHSDDLAEAHDFLESRQSIGKVVVKW